MFNQLDAALRSLLDGALPRGTEVRFAPPQDSWTAEGRKTPFVNAFLHQVVEDTQARTGAWVERRDGNGKVIARESAPRHYRACYSLTAWATDSDTEHALLGMSLTALATQDTIADAHLPPPLAGSGYPVTVSVAHPDLPRLGADTWSALKVPPRSGIDLVLATALVPEVRTDLPSAPTRVALGVADGIPARATANKQSDLPATEIIERPRSGSRTEP